MFEREEKIRYRVYSIEEGVCVVRIYQANDKKAFDVVSESINYLIKLLLSSK